jgi:hypothetical protein
MAARTLYWFMFGRKPRDEYPWSFRKVMQLVVTLYFLEQVKCKQQ